MVVDHECRHLTQCFRDLCQISLSMMHEMFLFFGFVFSNFFFEFVIFKRFFFFVVLGFHIFLEVVF